MDFEQYQRETKLKIEDAGRLISRLRASDRPANATVWRWCMRGLQSRQPRTNEGDAGSAAAKKVRLEYCRVGGRVMTTEQAVRRFLEATQDWSVVASPSPGAPPVVPNALNAAAVQAASERVASFMASPTQTRRPGGDVRSKPQEASRPRRRST